VLVLDPRLPNHTLVLGIGQGLAAKAYPLDRLRSPVTHDRVAGAEIVVLRPTGSWLATVFESNLGGRALTFIPDADEGYRDRESGSRWTRFGVAVSGRHAGRRLREIPAIVEEWYSWAARNPGGAIYQESRSSRSAF
jgi:hypothetical protein